MKHIALFGTLICCSLSAADVVELTPISDQVLALRVLDGHITRHGYGQHLWDDTAQVSPLSINQLSAAAFSVSSTLDLSYAVAVSPVSLGRKTKGADFACTNKNWTDGFMGLGYYPVTPTWASEHWIYLNLPKPLQPNKSYSIAWNQRDLNLSPGSITFQFVSEVVRSEAIHVNTIGYLPDAPRKYAYLYHWAGSQGGMDYSAWTGRPFSIIRESDKSVEFSGTIAFRASADNRETFYDGISPNANFLGAAVWDCDFTTFHTPGRYRLVIPGIGCSYPFDIKKDVYAMPFRSVMKGLYQNRSGIALEMPYADKPRPAPHNPQLTPGFSDRLFYTTWRFCDMQNRDNGTDEDKKNIELNSKGNLHETWGWYQDAGDWDTYFEHSRIPVGLLMLYLASPQRFFDGQLSIPENTNGVPDIIDEAAWLPRFYQRQRKELINRGWGTGGVGSRVFGDKWGYGDGSDLVDGVNTGSWGDVNRNWYVTGEDPFTTFRYASSAAMLAEVLANLGKGDPNGIDWKSEAVSAYNWAIHNSRNGDEQKDLDGMLADHRALAAIALYRLTGEATYCAQFLADAAGFSGNLTSSRLYSSVLYLTTRRDVDGDRAAILRRLITTTGITAYKMSIANRALRWGGNWWQPAGIGQVTTPYIQPLICAQVVQVSTNISDANAIRGDICTTADYFLGCNPLHTSWITGVGPRPPIGVFSFDDWACGPGARTGYTPYGPGKVGLPLFNPPLHVPGNQSWAFENTYPSILVGANPSTPLGDGVGSWPYHEAWFNLITAPQTGEFTVWQQNLNNAWTYGSLLPDPPSAGLTAPRVASGPPLVVSGISLPSVTVTIYVDGVVMGRTLASGDGSWTWTTTERLPIGRHIVTVTIAEGDGPPSAASPGAVLVIEEKQNGNNDGCGMGSLIGLLLSLVLINFVRSKRRFLSPRSTFNESHH